jgi:hypothetical protein
MKKSPANIMALIFSLTAVFFAGALLAAFAAPGSPPSDQRVDFDAALKTAEANRATTKGLIYDAAFVMKAASWLGAALYTCSRNLSGLDARPVVILVRVGADGKAEEVLSRPLTKVARCLRPRIVSAVHSKPPEPSWWAKLEVKIR